MARPHAPTQAFPRYPRSQNGSEAPSWASCELAKNPAFWTAIFQVSSSVRGSFVRNRIAPGSTRAVNGVVST